MNMCTRAPDLTPAELRAARGNVAKFAPLHGWGSDERTPEQLTTGELYSLIAWLRERNENLSTGKCRLNCRTERENFVLGYLTAWDGITANKDLTYNERQDLVEEAKNEWKRIKTSPRPRVSDGLGATMGKGVPRAGDGSG